LTQVVRDQDYFSLKETVMIEIVAKAIILHVVIVIAFIVIAWTAYLRIVRALCGPVLHVEKSISIAVRVERLRLIQVSVSENDFGPDNWLVIVIPEHPDLYPAARDNWGERFFWESEEHCGEYRNHKDPEQ
jgi:hypothetical protein